MIIPLLDKHVKSGINVKSYKYRHFCVRKSTYKLLRHAEGQLRKNGLVRSPDQTPKLVLFRESRQEVRIVVNHEYEKCKVR